MLMKTTTKQRMSLVTGGLVALLLLLSGCATTSQQQLADQAMITERGVSSGIAEKVSSNKALTGNELIELSQKGVDDAVLLRSIGRSRAIYKLDAKDVHYLTEFGLSETVVDAMLETARQKTYRNRYIDDYPGFYRPYRHGFHGHYGFRRNYYGGYYGCY